MKNFTDKTRRNLLKATAAVSVAAAGGLQVKNTHAAQQKQAPDCAQNHSQHGLGAVPQRKDGTLKVSGHAKYAAEYQVDNLLYGVVVQSTISSGRMTGMDTQAARNAEGVVAVYSHLNSLKINKPKAIAEGGAAQSTYTPIQNDRIIHNGQNIALVVAHTFEQATYAASLIRVEYAETPALIFPEDNGATPQDQSSLTITLGDAKQAMETAEVRISQKYATPREYNQPMEPHACIAHWQDDRLTVWEPSQWVSGARKEIADWMGIESQNVEIISPYVGGGFGSKASPATHVALACAASRELKRPVKVCLTRPQTFTGFGGRASTHQSLEMGATREGKILAIIHDGYNETSLDDVFAEGTNHVTARMYSIENITSHHRVVPINTVTPGWMRAPGENPSAFSLEVAMDEMAYELNMDPLTLRLKNWAAHDYQMKKPWSSRQLKEAYQKGAEAFGWSKRSMAPRSMRQGRELIGWGMASGTYPVSRQPAEAELVLQSNGQLTVKSAGADIGTGTYTILAQTAADVLKIPQDRISVALGDTRLPLAGVAGGSQLAGNLTAAVFKTAVALRERLFTLATETQGSPLHGTPRDKLVITDNAVIMSMRPNRKVTLEQLLQLVGLPALNITANTFEKDVSAEERKKLISTLSTITQPEDVSAHSWSALFVEVAVDEDFGTVRVKRLVGAFDSGRLYNPTLARSQWIGGMVMGMSQALLEEGQIDPRNGRVINNNLADYRIAVNADVPEITTIDVGQPDYKATVMGGKAVGELGIVGMAAAISNAVFHATGKRIRDLPITMDKLI
ncbi:MAG: xanthine dehydrogenase family protein molybdopterin-binding subunit [Enterobacterales bacterium endosymbiont of Blomia tropicalis]|uniref:xanthine dehydrogenase family protein molybdopterin-binding subunit n=1 Tax=Mixta mediterraneensis TaxID=2758443 RepID=UPI0025A8DC4C|nr:xanthine dehydrogenase family protein molybdopterin-binding subunit [Mixta mediterraneensis]MDL4912518.1 xanthine dehydrogenase family protein molybdopterin-binding subunit [Mixta mediterraneensis]